MTGLSASHDSSTALLRGPHCRNLVHCVNSPLVAKVSIGCIPTSPAAYAAGNRSLNERDAASVSSTTARGLWSGKVSVSRCGDESQEVV